MVVRLSVIEDVLELTFDAEFIDNDLERNPPDNLHNTE